ncbi:MAG: VCBS repeat-containing protein [Bacteroidales bacterium]|nr:VCBS repeat-containing protein [Bacteroidales bacterium]
MFRLLSDIQQMIRILLFFCGLLAFAAASAQELNDFGFAAWTEVPVKSDGLLLRDPWAGGINNVQFGKFDVNSDGISDLLIFDRHGDRLMPFVYQPEGASPGFDYAPEFRRYFPPLTQWFQTADYNNDGFMDIFTYTPGGIMVYRNRGTSLPSFEKAVDPYLTSLQGNIFTNLLVTYVDYPAIEDLDGDGDLDILTFWGLGSFVENHRNMSVETYGNSDSLLYHKVNNCWGRFAESSESNIIVFDTCIDFSRSRLTGEPKHTGSTFMVKDITGDSISDLVLGDVGFSDVVALRNVGTPMDALMVEQLTAWPAADPLHLWSFPLVQKIDLYNDGTEQILASPFDPSLVKSQGSESVWLYSDCKNGTGPDDCGLLTRSFLQDGMIDVGLGAYPVFKDIDNDGLTDLVVGNYGYYDTCVINNDGQLKCDYTGRLHLYLNNGTPSSPTFYLADNDFGRISQAGLLGVFPAFEDLDGDGDLDMLTGNSLGDLWLSINLAGPGNLPEFADPLRNFQDIGVEGFSTPVFIDINNDGLNDLVLGSVTGKLSYFKNTGSLVTPVFEMVTDFFGEVNVTDQATSYTGYSVPCFFRKPGGDLRLLVGSESGRMIYYSGISGLAGSAFVMEDSHFMYISEGIRIAPAWADINSDGYPELAAGNYCGGISLFRGIAPGPAAIDGDAENQGKMMIFPNPGNGIFKVVIDDTDAWQITIRTISGILLNSNPVYGSADNLVVVEEPYTGVVIVEARQTKPPWSVIREKVIIIR